MEKGGFVYIMTTKWNTVLYTGVTSRLFERASEHKHTFHPGSFTAKYNVNKLVYYQWFPTIVEAIAFEKKVKGGSRKKKIALIEGLNPGLSVVGVPTFPSTLLVNHFSNFHLDPIGT